MGLIYDMNKDRGATILVPTTMTQALGEVLALNAAAQQANAQPQRQAPPPAGSVPQA